MEDFIKDILDISVALLVLVIVIAAIFVIAYFMSIALFVKTAHTKKSNISTFAMWIIGLFTTPITLGILVAAQPDRGLTPEPQSHFQQDYQQQAYQELYQQ